jgi:hypothetical protein
MINEEKIYFVFATNGSIKNTGIETVALGLSTSFTNVVKFYSLNPNDANIPVLENPDQFWEQNRIVLFTYLEYRNLYEIVQKFQPDAIYVGDWILNYRKSLFRWKPNFFNFFKIILSFYRIINIKKHLRYSNLIFVNELDCTKAKKFGFVNSVTFPLGHFQEPDYADEGTKFFTNNRIVFSGNFDYDPNINVVEILIKFIQRYPRFNLVLIGKSANKFLELGISGLEIYSDVDSIVETLKKIKPIYVAPLFFGAGSKNKILDAAAARIPIICSRECLDSDFFNSIRESLSIVEQNRFVLTQINNHLLDIEMNGWDDRLIYQKVIRERCWPDISERFKVYLDEKCNFERNS